MIAASLLLVAVLVTSVAANPLESEGVDAVYSVVSTNITNEAAENQLYNSVVVGDYEHAVIKTFALENSDRSDVIVSVVNRLLSENQRNIVEYAYKLWNMFGQTIVKDYFPVEFRLILNNEHVQVINKVMNITIYLGLDTCNTDNKYAVVCNKKSQSLNFTIWRFIPVWEEKFIYFKIYNMRRHVYMDYSHLPNGQKSLEWYLVPTMFKGTLLFQIMTRFETSYRVNTVNCFGNYDRLQKKLITELELYGWYIKPVVIYN